MSESPKPASRASALMLAVPIRTAFRRTALFG